MRRPKLLDTLDRRETLCLLAGSMTGALLGGCYVFYYSNWSFARMIFWAGVLTGIQFLTGLPHLRRVTSAIYDADGTMSKAAGQSSNDTRT